MISKTKIGNRIKRKRDDNIVETILSAKKNKFWIKAAQILSGAKRKYPSFNLGELDSMNLDDKDTIAIPGKILGKGIFTKKLRVCAISFSESAAEKIHKSKSEKIFLNDEIKKNPEGKGVKLIWKKE